MRDVYVTARDGVFLKYDKRRDRRERWESVRDDDDSAGMMENIVFTVKAPSVKYLRGGTKFASPTNLDTL